MLKHAFYVSWRLWEAHLYVFYVSVWGLEGPDSADLSARVGPLKKTLTRAWGEKGAWVRWVYFGVPGSGIIWELR